jgi:hypothetical protein
LAVVVEGVGLATAYQANLKHETELAAALKHIDQSNAQLQDLKSQNQDLAATAAHPTLGTWNDCGGACTIEETAYREGSVPDTFTFHINYTSDNPVDVALLTLSQYVAFVDCPRNHFKTRATDSLLAECLTLIAGQDVSKHRGGTSVHFDFHDAEGCSDYVMIMVSDTTKMATVKPDIRVTYNPANHPTGVCAH